MAVFPVNLCKGSQCTFAVSLLVFVGCGFQRCPPGTEVAGRAICLNCCTGNRWCCLGRSEQTSPLQAFLEQDLVIWVVGRVGEWLSDSPGAFFPPAPEPPPSCIDYRFALHFATLILLRNNMGDLWLVHWMHKPVSPNYFMTLLMCFEEREIKKDYKTHPQPAAAHCSTISGRFVLSLKILITKRWAWWWAENLPPCPACWIRIKSHSQPVDFSLNSSNPC